MSAFNVTAASVPVVVNATARDTLFPIPGTNQRVQNLATGQHERWSGSAWVSDIPIDPSIVLGGNRTVATFGTYLSNNQVFNVLDYAQGVDVTVSATAVAQAAIDRASIAGGIVDFPAGHRYRIVGLVVRSAYPVYIRAYGAVLEIANTSAPFCTFYGVQHQAFGGQLVQANLMDQCQGYVWKNDATTQISRFCCARDVWAYSVHRAFLVDMLDLSGDGGNYRHVFDRCVAENYTDQGTWSGSYGFKFTGDVDGNAGGNDTKLLACTAKGYEKNIIVKNSTRLTLTDCSIDGGSIAIEYDAGGGLLLMGGYVEYNETVFKILNTPDKLVVLGTSFGNYTTLQDGALLNGTPIQGFDLYGNAIGNIPLIGGYTGSGVTRFTGVNEVSFAIGLALDKVIKYLTTGGYFALDLQSIGASVDFWLKRTTNGRILFGDPAGSYMGWDVANARAMVTSGHITLNSAGTVKLLRGTGSPNGVVTANPGSLYLNDSGGAGTSFYVKESGTGTNTGWVGK